MTQLNKYRLSLHVSHPTLAASDIIRCFKLPVKYSKSVGEKRKAKAGRDLGGVYSKTDVSFDVSDGVMSNDTTSFFDCLNRSFVELPHDAISDFVSSGGECFYLAGIYTDSNFMIYLPSDFLSASMVSSIGFKFDIYGGDGQ